MDLDRVDVVLLRPARPTNVAATCRAMKNMGLNSLRLVGFSVADVDVEARRLAYGAWDVLDAARSYAGPATATADASLVVGTSGRSAPGTCPPRTLAESASARMGSGRLALVFGPEASGLSDEDLALCHARVYIPSHPAQPSLNLAQAVLVVAYELYLVAGQGPGRSRSLGPPPARWKRRWRSCARAAGCRLPEPREPGPILSELRMLLARAGPTPREITLLRGLARQIRWAARVARSARETDNFACGTRRSEKRKKASVSELRVPTVAMVAEVTCLDGRAFRGRIFVPASASTHDGPMRAQEWMNASGQFFPFLPDDAEAPIILNKHEVLMLSLEGEREGGEAEGYDDVDRLVVVECGSRRLRGISTSTCPRNTGGCSTT